MNLQVNGKPREMADGSDLQQLLDSIDAVTAGTAVALNSEIIPREHYDDTILQEGDDIVIVHIVAGG
jgi:thiamine biosynthesis protein ThiS